MEQRFVQAHKEARLAVWLALAYLLAWCVAAYLPDSQAGVTGLPGWFEWSCLVLPLLFVGLCWLMVRFMFQDMSLEDTPEAALTEATIAENTIGKAVIKTGEPPHAH